MRALLIMLVVLLGVLQAQSPSSPPVQSDGQAATAPAASGTATGSEPSAGQEEPAAVASPRSGRRTRGLLDRRLRALDDRFPWLAPTESFQWVSLGVTLFALLSLAIHFAARLSATELLGFGRATLIAAWIMLAGFVQVAIVPDASPALALAVVVNAVMLLLCFRFVYDLSVPAAGLAVFLFAIESGLGLALLRLIDATLRSIGNATF